MADKIRKEKLVTDDKRNVELEYTTYSGDEHRGLLMDYQDDLKTLKATYPEHDNHVIEFHRCWAMLNDPKTNPKDILKMMLKHRSIIEDYYEVRDGMSLADYVVSHVQAASEYINAFKVVLDMAEDSMLRIRASGDKELYKKALEKFPMLDYLEAKWKEHGYQDSQGYTWLIHNKPNKGE